MNRFNYRALDSQGLETRGSIEASTKEEAMAGIREKFDWIIQLSPAPKKLELPRIAKNLPNQQELGVFTQQIALLLKNGVTLDAGLSALSRQEDNPTVLKFLKSTQSSLRQGKSLTAAFMEFPSLFDPLYLRLIEIGERSGTLSLIFSRLSEDMNFRSQLKSKILQAATYPSAVVFICALSIAFILNYVVPQMSVLFEGAENLPSYTQVLLTSATVFQNYQWPALFLIVVTGALTPSLLKKTSSNPNITTQWQQFPFLRPLLVSFDRLAFSEAMVLMLDAGFSPDKALQESVRHVKTVAMADALRAASTMVNNGAQFSTSLSRTNVLPPLFNSLLEAGEEAGDILPVFKEIQKKYRQNFEDRIVQFTTLLEPVLVLFMGFIVGGIVIIMLLSILSVNDLGI